MKRGFTLLELLVVLVIIAMVTGIAAVRLHGPYQAARIADTLARFEFADSQTRAHARASATPCDIVLDMDRGRVYSRETNGDDTRHFAFTLPQSLKIRHMATRHQQTDRGQVKISVSARGISPTYAVSLSASNDECHWLLFSGLTGQVFHSKDDVHVEQMLELLHPPRPDSH